MDYDVTIIGAGHNGLVAACYLAKSGLKTLVLERREVVGGGAVTEEFIRAFVVRRLITPPARFRSKLPLISISRDFGLEMITPEARVLALSPDGRSLCIYNDAARTVSGDRKVFCKRREELSGVCQQFLAHRESARAAGFDDAAVNRSTNGDDLWHLGKVGLAFRGLGKKDEYRLLRWGPMAVADLVSEWFETELLRATVAARGIHGAFAGPWSAGTSLGLLWQAAMDGSAIGSASYAKGGMGGLTEALANAAKAAGAEDSHGGARLENRGALTVISRKSCSRAAKRSKRVWLFRTPIRARRF